MTADSDSLFITSWHAHKFCIISLSGRNLGRNWPQTREIAADRVVLPWSTWPMVPMFTWGCKRDKLQNQEHCDELWAQLDQTSSLVVFDITTLASARRTTAEALDWPTSLPAKLGLLCPSDEHVTSCDQASLPSQYQAPGFTAASAQPSCLLQTMQRSSKTLSQVRETAESSRCSNWKWKCWLWWGPNSDCCSTKDECLSCSQIVENVCPWALHSSDFPSSKYVDNFLPCPSHGLPQNVGNFNSGLRSLFMAKQNRLAMTCPCRKCITTTVCISSLDYASLDLNQARTAWLRRMRMFRCCWLPQ